MQPPPRLGRRALLTLGAAAFVAGCGAADDAQPSWHGPSRAGPDPAPSGPSPAPSRSAIVEPGWDGPLPARAVPGVCPPGPDVLPKPGTEQYLPCSGTDVALTIDDGPDPVWTPKVLAVLARHRVRATFCMVGQNVTRHADLVAAVADAGHQLANHTYTHPMRLPQLAPERIRRQIERTNEALAAATGGSQPTLFRAPGGSWSPNILAACAETDLRPLDWSVDARDWALPGVRTIAEVILTRTRPGSIILNHDGGGDRHQTVEALNIALPRLVDAGYRFILP